jgi:predicted Zn-dependent protease
MDFGYNDYDRRARGAYDRGNFPTARGILYALLRNPRVLLIVGLLGFGVFKYFGSTEKKENPFTGESVRVALKPEQEVALGLQAAPQMIREFGGELRDAQVQRRIDGIGQRLLGAKDKVMAHRGIDDFDYPFRFHILQDDRTINAFALPGGPVFITQALLRQLPSDDAVAGVIGHEIGHVLAWHSNQRMAQSSLFQSIAGAVSVAADDPRIGQAAGQFVGQFLQTKYGREDESQSDAIGVQLMIVAGYRPEALMDVMEVLQQSMKGPRGPEILSTHPFPETRKKQIVRYIEFFRADPLAEWDASGGWQ